jgi:hypothetical protein
MSLNLSIDRAGCYTAIPPPSTWNAGNAPPTSVCTPWTRKHSHRTPLQHAPDPGGVRPWPHAEAWEGVEFWAAARTSLLQCPISRSYGLQVPCHLRTVPFPSAPRPPARLYPPRMRTSQPESLLTSMALPRRQLRPARGWSARYVMMRWCVIYLADSNDFAANHNIR